MFTGTRKKREMDWQLIASYFTVKSTDIFCSALGRWQEINIGKSVSVVTDYGVALNIVRFTQTCIVFT